jgi:hypothetical protein
VSGKGHKCYIHRDSTSNFTSKWHTRVYKQFMRDQNKILNLATLKDFRLSLWQIKMQLNGTLHRATGKYLPTFQRHHASSKRRKAQRDIRKRRNFSNKVGRTSVYTRLTQFLTLHTAKCQVHSLAVGRVRFTH